MIVFAGEYIPMSLSIHYNESVLTFCYFRSVFRSKWPHIDEFVFFIVFRSIDVSTFEQQVDIYVNFAKFTITTSLVHFFRSLFAFNRSRVIEINFRISPSFPGRRRTVGNDGILKISRRFRKRVSEAGSSSRFRLVSGKFRCSRLVHEYFCRFQSGSGLRFR